MDYILWEISYTNLMMLTATIPGYKKDEDEESTTSIEVDDLTSLEDFLKS